jgi:hypothetical protein
VPATCARQGCALRAARSPTEGGGRWTIKHARGAQTGAPENIVKELERLQAPKEHELGLRLEWAPEGSGP